MARTVTCGTIQPLFLSLTPGAMPGDFLHTCDLPQHGGVDS